MTLDLIARYVLAARAGTSEAVTLYLNGGHNKLDTVMDLIKSTAALIKFVDELNEIERASANAKLAISQCDIFSAVMMLRAESAAFSSGGRCELASTGHPVSGASATVHVLDAHRPKRDD